MNILRFTIDNSAQIIGYLRRHRKIAPKSIDGVVKINLGCGMAVAKGWTNIDGSLNALASSWPHFMHKILYRASGSSHYYSIHEYCSILEDNIFIHHVLSYGIPFVDESVDVVYSSHFLEHLHQHEAMHLLKETLRVLKPGGLVRICIPDLSYAICLYSLGKKKQMLSDYFFVETKESYFARHKYMYDFELLSESLSAAGFVNIVRCSYRQGNAPDLNSLDNRPEETLFVEANKFT